jgi:hypothetical protein
MLGTPPDVKRGHNEISGRVEDGDLQAIGGDDEDGAADA